MKIVMDFRKYDGVVGGTEQGAIQITRHICGRGDEVILVCKRHRLQEVEALLVDVRGLSILPLNVRSHLMSLRNVRLDSMFLQNLAVKEDADLIHFYYNWSFPFRKKVPCVLTVHDVIPFTFREAMGFLMNRLIYRPSLRLACKLNDVIVTVSQYSRKDIARKVGVPVDKIRVIPNGLREPTIHDPERDADVKKRFGLGAGYVLNVGGIHERKNIARLVQAFARVCRSTGYKGSLVVTGSISGAPYQEKMRRLCEAAVACSRMQGRVVFTGFVTEQEVDALFRGADLFAYPSLYEGFGIPVLEAMKAGTPVVTSNLTAMPEVAGDAAVSVNPYSVEELATAMERVLSDHELRTTLKRKGAERAQRFSWQITCEEYYRLYEELSGRVLRS